MGVFIDSNFRWCKHIHYIRQRLASAVFAINELKSVISLEALKILYYANVHSIINYGIIFWGDSIDSNKIFVLQKRALLCMLKLQYLEHCREYFKLHDILPLPCVYIYECVSFVKRHYTELFYKEPKNPYDTRNKGKFISLPKTRLKLVDKGPYCKCITIFNNLPEHIKILSDVLVFRREVKKFLLQHCFYSVQEYLQCK